MTTQSQADELLDKIEAELWNLDQEHDRYNENPRIIRTPMRGRAIRIMKMFGPIIQKAREEAEIDGKIEAIEHIMRLVEISSTISEGLVSYPQIVRYHAALKKAKKDKSDE